METLPRELREALDKGDVDAAQKHMPNDFSKGLQKKIIRHAHVNLQKIQQGKKPQPINEKIFGQQETSEKKTLQTQNQGATSPTSSAQINMVVDDLLDHLSILVSSDVMELLRSKRSSLSSALHPRLTALRNLSYAEGFNARAQCS